MPIIVALLLLVISGLVAAAGDYMGQRAARRKVRIGKLRPRYVSRLIAVISGMLISLATYGAMFFLYSDFRNALTQYSTVKQQRDQATADLKTTQGSLDKLNGDLTAAKGEISQLQSSKIQLVKDADGARQASEAAKAQLGVTQRLVASAEQNLKQTNAKLSQAHHELSAQRGKTTIGAIQLDQYKQGDVILQHDTPLAQVIVKADQAGQVGPLVTSAVDGIRKQLDSDLKMKLAGDSDKQLKDFLAHYPYASPPADAVVNIAVANNTLAGEVVHLKFAAAAVKPLLHAGALLLTLRITDKGARIETLGRPADNIPFPDGVNEDAIKTAITACGQDFVEAMQDYGFIPPPGSDPADLAHGVLQIVALGNQLLTHERPFVVQVAAKQDLTNLDWPTDLSINVFKEPGS